MRGQNTNGFIQPSISGDDRRTALGDPVASSSAATLKARMRKGKTIEGQRNRDDRKSRIDRSQCALAEPFRQILGMVRDGSLRDAATFCQGRQRKLKARVRQTRYEDCGVAVGLIYTIKEDPRVLDVFAEEFEHDFRREPKANRIDREVFLFLYGEARKDLAGTDAMALAAAIRRRIEPERIPAYIRVRGGFQKLLQIERRRRDKLVSMEMMVRPSVKKQLDALDPGRHSAMLEKSRSEPPRYAIVKAG